MPHSKAARLHSGRQKSHCQDAGGGKQLQQCQRYRMQLKLKQNASTCAVAGLLVEGSVLLPRAGGAGKGCVKLPKPPELCCMAPKLFCG